MGSTQNWMFVKIRFHVSKTGRTRSIELDEQSGLELIRALALVLSEGHNAKLRLMGANPRQMTIERVRRDEDETD